MTPILATLGFGGAEVLLIAFIAFLFVLPFAIIPAVLAYVLLDRIPPAHQKQQPGLALLLLIPLFSVIWAFFVYPRISDSLQSYFAARGENRGDCGRSLAVAACICSACGLVPFVGLLTGTAALVLLIIFFVKSFELTGQISRLQAGGAGTPAAPLPTA